MSKLLVIGCGRSGTHYAMRAFRLAGLDIGHESVSKNGASYWQMTVDEKQHRNFDLLIHQVRNPVNAVASMHTMDSLSWGLIYEHISEINPDSPVLMRCMQYWLLWNRLAEKAAEWTYRVEDQMEETVMRVVDRFGVTMPVGAIEKMRALPNDLNTRSRGRKSRAYPHGFTLDGMRAAHPRLTAELVEQAHGYGYDLR